MPSIGAVTVELLSGNTMPQSQRVDVWHIPGETGIGAQRMGLNQSSFSYRAVLYGVLAPTEARLVSLAALQGFVVSITDDHGDVRANCLLVQVSEPQRVKVIREGVTEIRATVQVRGVRTA